MQEDIIEKDKMGVVEEGTIIIKVNITIIKVSTILTRDGIEVK